MIPTLRGPIGPLMLAAAGIANNVEQLQLAVKQAIALLECGRVGEAADLLREAQLLAKKPV